MHRTRVPARPLTIEEWQLDLETLRARRISERTGEPTTIGEKTFFPISPADSPFGV